MKRWTIEETLFLRVNYKRHEDAKWIAAQLGRNHGAVQQKIHKLGIAIPNRITWSPDEILFLQRNYQKHTNRELASMLRKKRTILRMKLYELGLSRGRGKPFTQEEDSVIISYYRVKGDTAIATLLEGRTKKTVRKRRLALGLLRTKAEIAAIMKANKPRFLKHCFKPGHNGMSRDMKKAWQTRRSRDYSHDFIIQQIQQRETRMAL